MLSLALADGLAGAGGLSIAGLASAAAAAAAALAAAALAVAEATAAATVAAVSFGLRDLAPLPPARRYDEAAGEGVCPDDAADATAGDGARAEGGFAVDLAGLGGALVARAGVEGLVWCCAVPVEGDGPDGAFVDFWGMGLRPKETLGWLSGAAAGEGGRSAAGFSAALASNAGALEPEADEDEPKSSMDCSSRGGVCGRISAAEAMNSSIVDRMWFSTTLSELSFKPCSRINCSASTEGSSP